MARAWRPALCMWGVILDLTWHDGIPFLEGAEFCIACCKPYANPFCPTLKKGSLFRIEFRTSSFLDGLHVDARMGVRRQSVAVQLTRGLTEEVRFRRLFRLFQHFAGELLSGFRHNSERSERL